MEEERSLLYTVILGVCMLLSLLLIGRMLLGHPDEAPVADGTGQGVAQPETDTEPQPEDEVNEIQLTENDLSTLIVQKLSFTPDRIAVQISRDGTVSINATVRRDTLLESGVVSGGLRTALMFLPEECGMQGAWTVSLRDGTIALADGRMEVAGISLPGPAVEAATGKIAEGLNQVIAGWNIAPAELGFEDGVIRVKE